jgi:hypothetical protein
VTDVFQWTLSAFGASGNAQSTAVMDNLMREINPFWLWNHLHQVLLDVFGIVGFREFQPSRYAMDVGIDHNAHAYSKP